MLSSDININVDTGDHHRVRVSNKSSTQSNNRLTTTDRGPRYPYNLEEIAAAKLAADVCKKWISSSVFLTMDFMDPYRISEASAHEAVSKFFYEIDIRLYGNGYRRKGMRINRLVYLKMGTSNVLRPVPTHCHALVALPDQRGWEYSGMEGKIDAD